MSGLRKKGDSDLFKLKDCTFLNDICGHDIIFLSEIHCSNDDDISIDGYECFKLCRSITSKINRYFGGIAIYYRKELKKGIKFLEHKNDDYVWLKFCKYFFGLNDDYFLCYSYVPPENSSYYKTRKQDTLAYIESDILSYTAKGNVLLCGDLNARTGCSHDFITHDDDIGSANSPFYSIDNEIITRCSQDSAHLCNRGKQILDLCTSSK